MFFSAHLAGKGTHRLRSSLQSGLAHATGDLLRAAVKAQSELGVKKAKVYGCWSAVPDQLVIDLVESAFLQTCKRLVLFLMASHATLRQ